MPGHFEKAPNRPLYLRQIRQLLRAAGSSIDERSGFRGLLDLLHQAQREGWLRLHRDRKGVWRVFPAGSRPRRDSRHAGGTEAPIEAPLELGPGLEPELEPEIEADLLMPVETDVNWEAEALPEEITEPTEPLPPPPLAVEDLVLVEPTPKPKSRKPRASKVGAKSRTRRRTK